MVRRILEVVSLLSSSVCRIRTSVCRVVPKVSRRAVRIFPMRFCADPPWPVVHEIFQICGPHRPDECTRTCTYRRPTSAVLREVGGVGPAIRVRTVDLGYVSEDIVLVRVLHEKVLGDPFPAATTHIGKMFWTRVWVESLDMLPFGYFRPVYIGLHRVVSSIPLNVVASLAMVAFGSSRLLYIGLHTIASSTPFDVVASSLQQFDSRWKMIPPDPHWHSPFGRYFAILLKDGGW